MPDFVRTGSEVDLGCGIAVSPIPPPNQLSQCDNPAERYALKAANGEVTVAIMISCQFELLPQPIPGSSDGQTRVDDASLRPDGSHYEYKGHNEAADAFIEIVNATLAGG